MAQRTAYHAQLSDLGNTLYTQSDEDSENFSPVVDRISYVHNF